jgi:EVE domain
MKSEPRYWVIAASRDHASLGIKKGFIQTNHGKEAPLRRMSAGDWVLFYSPKETFKGRMPCRKFTGLGQVQDDRIYQVKMTDNFHAFRKSAKFLTVARSTAIEPLILELTFIRNKKSWGYAFRFGLIQIPRTDFLLIAGKMLEGRVTDAGLPII